MIANFTKYTAPAITSNRLVISISGRDKQGKSSFGFSAPEPILYFNFDIGDEGVINKYSSKEIYINKYRINPFATVDQQRELWTKVKADYNAALSSKAKTIVLDTATEVWELNRLARLGKLSKVLAHQYTEVNMEHTALLKSIYDSDKNLVLLHKSKVIYLNDKRTDNYEPKCYSDTPYIVQINLEMYRDDEEGFMMRILNCRQNPDLAGMEVPIYDPMDGWGILSGLVQAQ